MIKLSYFPADAEHRPAIPLFGPADSYFEKTAEPVLLGEVSRYIAGLKPRDDAQYVLVNAMGAGEWWGQNSNGDHFEEAGLIHRPDGWTGDPDKDRIRAKDWPYGFPTFYSAFPYLHHRNRNTDKAYGEVELAAWNPRMKRVELVIRLDKDKCEQFGAIPVWDKLRMGQYVDVSMGSRVCYDCCIVCLDWDLYRKAGETYDPKKHKYPGEAILAYHRRLQAGGGKGIRGLSVTRKEYCQHTLSMMNKILPDGRKVGVYNPYPRFFDISFVFIGADKTAKVMLKIASDGKKFWFLPGAELAENLGYSDGEKTASDVVHHKVKFQGIPVHIDRPKGFVQEFANKQTRIYKTDYGFIPGTKAKDGEELDVYLGKDRGAEKAYLIKQMLHGKEDERKLMLGFPDESSAKKMFLDHFAGSKIKKTVIGGVDEIPMVDLKSALAKKAALKKARLLKKSEILKDVVPSQFAGKAIPLLTRGEKDLPEELIRAMATRPLEESLSTAGHLGVILRPREFQRVTLIRMGHSHLADDLDRDGICFPSSESPCPMDLGPQHFHHGLASLFGPLLPHRSAFAPMIERRVVILAVPKEDLVKKSSSHTTELLNKLASVYTGYRNSLMNLFETPLPIEEPLSKFASDACLTPLSVAYIKTAFLDELPEHPGAILRGEGFALNEHGSAPVRILG